MIDKATVDKIFETANIVDVVGDFVALKKKGTNYTACCPFHQEKTPSFMVSPAKNLFKCFGCGRGGNPITFVMEMEHCSYTDALKWVARKYSIEIREKEMTLEQQQQNDDRESMMVLLARAAELFHENLDTEEGKLIGMSYFKERGFNAVSIEKFQLGYALDKRNAFTAKMLSEGYQEKFLLDTGLSIKSERGEVFDRFYGRIIFPIHSLSGRSIGFGGRTLKTDKNVAKYQNSPESEIYHKRKVLYGLFQAKRAIAKQDQCILVEGYADVISMHQLGVENVVASSGTALTEEQVQLIGRFTRNVLVIYDSDSAGINAALKSVDIILAQGMNVRIVLLPQGEDPDTFAQKNSLAFVEDYLNEHEQDFLSFYAQILLKESQGDPIKRAEAIKKMAKSIAIIPDAIQRGEYIKTCARLMDVSEEVLGQEIRHLKAMGGGTANSANAGGTGAGSGSYVNQPSSYVRKTEGVQTSIPTPHVSAAGYCREQEKNLVYFMLKYGDRIPFYQSDQTLAQYVIQDIEADELVFFNPDLWSVFLIIKQRVLEGLSLDSAEITQIENPELCSLVVDMLSTKYELSSIWKGNDMDAYFALDGNLSNAITTSLLIYKAKILHLNIVEAQEQLTKKNLELEGELDESCMDLMRLIQVLQSQLNHISATVNRVTL